MAVVDNTAHHRFELAEGGGITFADYRLVGEQLFIPHVETPPALRGAGSAGRLMEGIVQHARARHLVIVPSCPYAAAWLRRHPEHADLIG
jgi:predicted GNAT family acetyltransferase